MNVTYRLLVTGSRDWDDVTTVAAAIEQAVIDAGPRKVIVVHGSCPSGADWHADHYARWMRGKGVAIDVEPHPADWGQHGRAAGPLRNAAMVEAGADACLAFIGPCTSPRCAVPGQHPSHGATGCADLAEAAGIPTRRWVA